MYVIKVAKSNFYGIKTQFNDISSRFTVKNHSLGLLLNTTRRFDQFPENIPFNYYGIVFRRILIYQHLRVNCICHVSKFSMLFAGVIRQTSLNRNDEFMSQIYLISSSEPLLFQVTYLLQIENVTLWRVVDGWKAILLLSRREKTITGYI